MSEIVRICLIVFVAIVIAVLLPSPFNWVLAGLILIFVIGMLLGDGPAFIRGRNRNR